MGFKRAKWLKQKITNSAKNILPYELRIALRKINWKRKYAAAKWSAKDLPPVYCPIIGKEYRCFIKKWNLMLSPENGANNNQRLVWLYLKNRTSIFKSDKPRILHVAPELAFSEQFAKIDNPNYYPSDKMEKGYTNQKGVNYLDLTDNTLSDNLFDFIICNHVLEHIPDDRKAMSEMYRILKPGGKAIITVPLRKNMKETYEDDSIQTPLEREKHFGQWNHLRYYGMDIKDRLDNAGFHVKMILYAKEFSEEERHRYGLANTYIIDCSKA